jgi:hypothetical protein
MGLRADEDGGNRWGSVLRKVLKTIWVLINLPVLIVLPVAAWDMYRHDMAPHFIAWFVSGVFVLLALPITFYEVRRVPASSGALFPTHPPTNSSRPPRASPLTLPSPPSVQVAQHLENYRMPRLQRHVIRILFMVPIYAVDCWLALRFKDSTIYFDTVRECYEAYVIYNFYTYCTVYLQEFCNPGLEHIVARKPQQSHVWPVSAFLDMPKMGEPFLRLCRHGVIAYVVARPLTTALAFVTEANGAYGDGQITNFWVAYPYLAFVNNFSQAWAMYCLILFYRATYEELAPIRPFYKFLTVKAVVFLSFWQGQAILLAVKYKIIVVKETWTDYDAADVATGLQEFAICIEMFFAAIAHAYAFPPSEYAVGAQSTAPARKLADNIADMFDLRDVYHDVVNFSESNKDEVWAEVNYRYRKFVGMFTGSTPLRGAYARVADGEGGTVGEIQMRETDATSRGGGASPTTADAAGGRTSVGGGRRRESDDLGTEVALFAGVAGTSPRAGAGSASTSPRFSSDGGAASAAPRGKGTNHARPAAFSMPGVSAIPGVENGAVGGAMAPVEREGRVGSSRFTLE